MAQNSVRRRVEFGEADPAGILFYPNYYRWFDQATHDLFRSLGWTIALHLEEGYAIPLVETGATFRGPVRYDDCVEITSAVTEVRSRSFRVQHTVRHEGHEVCIGFEVRVWARLDERGRAIQTEMLPRDLRERLVAGMREEGAP
ncbi:MAG TPA: thioesterase family protein [Chloroflexota bacterium]|nr:thioesterase family protein [Chloroflexota bacterium]